MNKVWYTNYGTGLPAYAYADTKNGKLCRFLLTTFASADATSMEARSGCSTATQTWMKVCSISVDSKRLIIQS